MKNGLNDNVTQKLVTVKYKLKVIIIVSVSVARPINEIEIQILCVLRGIADLELELVVYCERNVADIMIESDLIYSYSKF